MIYKDILRNKRSEKVIPNLEATGSSPVTLTTLLTLIPPHIMSSKVCSQTPYYQWCPPSIMYLLSHQNSTRFGDEFNAHNLNPDIDNETQQTYTDGGETYTDIAMDVTGSKRQLLQSKIVGYLRKSKKIMKTVSTGVFP